MITLEQYWMGREKEYPLSIEYIKNSYETLLRVNMLLHCLEEEAPEVSSGYRPGRYNTKAGGAKKSLHLTCQAIDLKDPDGSLAEKITSNKYILDYVNLYLESPEYTKGWVHLDTKLRKNRIFIP